MGKKNGAGELQGVDIFELNLDEDLQDFLTENGIAKMPQDMALDIGEELMKYIHGSAKRLAKILEGSRLV